MSTPSPEIGSEAYLVRDSLQQGCFYQINVFPLLAFDPPDTVY